MRLARRFAAQLAATLLATSQWPPAAISADNNKRAVAIVCGGFLIPPEQYKSYAKALEEVGCAAALYADGSTLSKPQNLDEGARAILEQADFLQRDLSMEAEVPLVLLGHSRGAKVATLAAAQSKRKVAALVLLDPVDATGPDPTTVLPQLESLSKVPTAILGSGAGAGDCSQNDYLRFEAALGKATAPRLVGVLARAGHTQFVDNRRVLTVDVCTTGRDKDPVIREVALAATSAWVGAALPPGGLEAGAPAVMAPGARLQGAVADLSERSFAAAVEWRSADL